MGETHRKTIGVIAGMGPFAGAHFLRALMERARDAHGARANADFPHVLLGSLPVPDLVLSTAREDALREALEAEAIALARAGADFLVVVCNTVHHRLASAAARAGCGHVSMVTSTVDALARDQRRRVALLATATTIARGVYDPALEAAGIARVDLEEREQAVLSEIVHRGIGGTLTDADRAAVVELRDRSIARGADAVVLACTELSLLGVDTDATGPTPTYDALDHLVRASCEAIYGER